MRNRKQLIFTQLSKIPYFVGIGFLASKSIRTNILPNTNSTTCIYFRIVFPQRFPINPAQRHLFILPFKSAFYHFRPKNDVVKKNNPQRNNPDRHFTDKRIFSQAVQLSFA